MVPERIFLVDGMSQIYRAYHAIRNLTNKEGKPTNAVYGFTTMLRRLINEEEPDYLAVAMESKGPTVRHEQYEDYKANRPRMPDDLAEQIPYVEKVCQALRVPILEFERYEADDVIGTLASKAEAAGHQVVIVTIDKDMFQLVNQLVQVLDPRTMTYLDSSKVVEKMGVEPGQVIDYLALVGDTSDNIPGAPGIGVKGAAKLIGEYGDLENLLAHADAVGRKSYRESLQDNREQIMQSRELVTIHRELDLPLDMDDLRREAPDNQKTFELFTELGFKSLVEDFVQPTKREDAECREISGAEAVKDLLEEIAGRTVSLAVEYPEGDPEATDWLGLALSAGDNQSFYLDDQTLRKQSGELEALWDKPGAWVVHDLKQHLLFQLRGGRPARPRDARDTMLMGYLLQPNQNDFSLPSLAADYLGQVLKDGAELFDDPRQELADRAAVVRQLDRKLLPEIEEKGMSSLLEEIETPLVRVLAEMEVLGVKIDCRRLKAMSQEQGDEIKQLSQRIHDLAGETFNINSPRQLGQILFDQMGLPQPKKTRKAGHYSTSVEVLEKLAEEHEIVRLVLEYREASKLKSTYLDALPSLVDPRSGRLHTSYNQMVAATGRLSSSNPNLQNIPIKSEQGRRVRRAFVAEEGFSILAADYSQIELRVMAHLSQDPVLLESFREGQDIHERTAREVFGMHAVMEPDRFRRHAKVINFGIMYGLSAFGLAQSLKIERKEAQKFIDDYFARYSGVKEWIDKTLRQVREHGYVSTLFGRIRQIPEIRSRNWNLRHFGERTAINAPIQGTAADLIKKAMVEIHRRLQKQEMKSRMIMQVHDELVFEVADDEAGQMQSLVPEVMEGVASLDVPLKVDQALGPTWYDAK
ncbi:MAG TPA: DNA polymerase I [Acidobacteriota bacterium]|nr:DNA polymerase I [Acidobacteriota bacterium]